MTIDERIRPFKGRVGFKVFVPEKPEKYGIKIWVSSDPTNYFISNFKIYSGMSNGIRDTNKGENVVLDLKPHLNSGHNITTDNFFTLGLRSLLDPGNDNDNAFKNFQ